MRTLDTVPVETPVRRVTSTSLARVCLPERGVALRDGYAADRRIPVVVTVDRVEAISTSTLHASSILAVYTRVTWKNRNRVLAVR